MNMNRVGIFWDYENCAPPSGTPGYVVAERLRATCSAHGSVTQFRAYLELSAPPPTTPSQSVGVEAGPSDLSRSPTSPKTLTLRSELQSSGVSLIDCPHNSRKNVADSMLACDLVCFALDNPTPQIPYTNYLPTSPYSVPNTPFPAIFPAPLPSPKTTIVLISGDRDFAYPLAVLKARKYDVGLIVPPGGAHPALRAQATWVMNWKDVLEGGNTTDGRCDVTVGTTSRGRADNVGMEGQTNGFTLSMQGTRRPSFASRRGSVSSPRRGSVSNLPSMAPPPPHLTTTSAIRPSATFSFSTPEVNEGPSTSLLSQPALECPLTSQLLSTSRPSRKSPLRRPAAKAGSRPPSRAKSRLGPRSNRSERIEQETLQSAKPEQPRPHPLIVPVPLTASPIGSTGPSLAGVSPRAGRPQTPPLFSTNPASPPPPAAPPALPPPATPPTKTPTPPAKPPTPPRDALRASLRPPIPHVATPRPPIPDSSQPTVVGAPGSEDQCLNAPASTSLVAPTPKPGMTALQALLPVAAALRSPEVTNPTRPVLAVPPSVQASNASTLAPATPVTPPASPPFRWARLPVQDDTDGDGERPATIEKRRKDKAKERTDPVRSSESHSLANPGETMASGSKKHSRLAIQVEMVLGGSEEPSAISGVDSILRSYTERSPKVEQDDQKRHSLGNDHISPVNPVKQEGEANALLNLAMNDDDEEEEQFHEMFLATFSRPSACSNAPRTPATVKLVSLELATEESAESSQGTVDHKRPRITTPRPVPRSSNSLPALMMQSLLAGVEGTQSISNDHPDMAEARLQSHDAPNHCMAEVDDPSERLYSRANSPPPTMPPAIHRRKTSPSRLPGFVSEIAIDSSVDATYREFQFLISVLEKCRRNGQERPLRSLIGAEFTRDVFEQVRATSFKDHVQRAVTAGVVSVGGGSIQGREWISLNRNWQGFGLVID
ncbi:unnamed protein product [Rhizoctonia solani]|uniref:NYN domain-containing protein n=1 Tax=Rhizoctonia solani TaxID=456999 RepID=A0A8H3AE88_9AGAM|nr:unnamed protein product [Rhizoctonia solani]